MNILILLSQILCWGSFLILLLTIIKSPPGLMGGMIWVPKLLSSAWSPIIVVFAFTGVIMAGMVGQFVVMSIGLLAVFLGIRHIRIISREHHQFDEYFGKQWKDYIPPSLGEKFLSRRYQCIQPPSPPSLKKFDVVVGKNIETGRTLLCNIHEPNFSVSRSGLAIIFLHGGAWQAFDKGILVNSPFNHLCEQGHLIVDLAYSLAPEANLNQMLLDVQQTIIWLKSHAHDFQINPDRIVLMGVSGGAQLALLTAYAQDHPTFQKSKSDVDFSVRAVISSFAITDMGQYFEEYGQSTKKQPVWSSEITEELLPKVHDKTWLDRWMTKSRIFPAYRYGNMPGGALLLVNLIGGTLKEIPDIYRQASPVFQVNSNCPATLLIYAQQDFFVDVSHGRRLHETLKKSGIPSLLIEVPETVHSFYQYFGISPRIAPGAQTVMYDIERFLALMV